MQTELMAFRRALSDAIAKHPDFDRFLPGGLHMDLAPQLRDGEPPPAPYAVATFISTPSGIGNDTHRTITGPLVRVMVWMPDYTSHTVENVERAARWLDRILERMTAQVDDPEPMDDPLTGNLTDDTFVVRGFYREQAYHAAIDDGSGNLYTRAGGDYRGTGFYYCACS